MRLHIYCYILYKCDIFLGRGKERKRGRHRFLLTHPKRNAPKTAAQFFVADLPKRLAENLIRMELEVCDCEDGNDDNDDDDGWEHARD